MAPNPALAPSIAAVALCTLLAACGGSVPLLPGLSPYKIDVQQGNVVTQEMIAKLKPGMTRQQVRFVMGTPPIVDPFRNDRWDYVYLYRKGAVVAEQRRIVLLFEGEYLKRIEGDVVPTGDRQERTPEGKANAPLAPTAAGDERKP